MKTRPLALLLALLAPAAGCSTPADCEKACSNVVALCAGSASGIGLDWTEASCLEDCRSTVEKCETPEQTLGCLESASACGEVFDCPICGRVTPEAIALPACAQACANAEAVCREDFAPASLDSKTCAQDCLRSDCSNIASMAVCAARAATCEAVGQCPACIGY